MLSQCTTRRCEAPATVRVITDRPKPGTPGSPLPAGYVCWSGHFDHAYCQEHALMFARGTAEYGDVITLRPVPVTHVSSAERIEP